MQLSLENIDLELGGKPVLSDVSFTVGDGQFVSVLGKSGAGKSTTLKVIAGLLPQDSGRVLFGGECVDDVPTHKRNTAIVFQDIRLFPNMDVRQNVAFPLKMRKGARAERLRIADEMLAAVQLEGFGDRRTYELSGGQQQRVAVARALAARPRALLLDEPFSGLDEQLRAEMRDLVMRLHAEFGMTSLMVTHDPDEALVMSDRIIYMHGGRVVQDGAPADLLLHPADDAVRGAFNDAASIEGQVSGGIFTGGKLRIPIADLAVMQAASAQDAIASQPDSGLATAEGIIASTSGSAGSASHDMRRQSGQHREPAGDPKASASSDVLASGDPEASANSNPLASDNLEASASTDPAINNSAGLEIPDGPAVLVRVPDRVPFVHSL